jgi:hypothetical protein
MHTLLLILEIFFGSIAGLIGLGFIVSALKSNVHQIVTWNPAVDIPYAMNQAAHEGWPHRALVAFDIFVNVVLCKGQQDETISTHSWRAAQEGKTWGKVMCWWLNLFQDNHGPQAASGDLLRATERVEVLKKALGL